MASTERASKAAFRSAGESVGGSGSAVGPETPNPDFRALRELSGVARGLIGLPALAREWGELPRAVGRAPVLVLPGFLASDASTLVLRRLLAGLGHRVYGWGRGRNLGDVAGLLPGVVETIARLRRRHGHPVQLVGWSLGGVLAREATRELARSASIERSVRRILTLGTPVVGGPKYTAAAPRYRKRGVDLDAIEQRIAERNREVLPVPITAIYSRRDGVVSWRACIDPNPGNRVEHVEVDLGHSELGFSPTVVRLLAARLASATSP